MRIACCYPDTPKWPKYRWVHEALSDLGHDCVWVRTREELMAVERSVDVSLFAHKSFPIRWPNLRDIWEQRESLWVQWWFDLICLDKNQPVAGQPMVKQYQKHFDAMDIVFVKEREYLGEFKAAGIPAEYLDQGCPATMQQIDYDTQIKWDVLLWGQSGPEYKQRTRDVESLVAAGYSVAWAGATRGVPRGVESLPWTHPDDLPGIASQAACVLCVDRRADIDGYWSDRIWLALGMGAVVVSRKPLGADRGTPCLTYGANRNGIPIENAVGMAAKSKQRKENGEEARKWVMQQHTIKHRCQELITRVSAECATAKAMCG